MEIKLKKEEEDRQLRRKRVEAIMLRTRNQGKGLGTVSTKVCTLCTMTCYVQISKVMFNLTIFY